MLVSKESPKAEHQPSKEGVIVCSSSSGDKAKALAFGALLGGIVYSDAFPRGFVREKRKSTEKKRQRHVVGISCTVFAYICGEGRGRGSSDFGSAVRG